MKRYLKKKKYYTNGIRNYVRKWGSDDQEIMKQIGVQYRLVGVFVEQGKWKKMIRHPLFTVAMYYLRLRVAIGYLQNKR